MAIRKQPPRLLPWIGPSTKARLFAGMFLAYGVLSTHVDPRCLFIPGYREPLAILAAFWGKTHGCVNVLMLDSTAIDLARSTWREKIKAWMARCFFHKAFVSGKRSAAYLQSLCGKMLPFEEGYDVVDNAFFASRVAAVRVQRQTREEHLPHFYS